MRSLWFFAMLAGCARPYVPMTLDARVALSELREERAQASKDGLSPDDAVAIALVQNFELRALRRELQVAEGAVLSAGAWKNPELRLSLQHLLSANPAELALGVRFFPPPPDERDAEIERARAHEQRVLAEVEDLENRVAAKVLLDHARLVLIAEKRRLLEATAKACNDVLRMEERRMNANVSTRLELLTATLACSDVARDQAKLTSEQHTVEARLAGMLGVPNIAVPLLQGPVCVPVSPATDEELELAALERPDLRALKEAYQEREQSVRLEHVQRTPWASFLEPSISGIGNPTHVGLDVQGAIELPIGISPVIAAEAQREALRDKYLALLQSVRVEIRAARAKFEDMAERRRYIAENVEPILAEAERALQQGIDSAEVDPLKLAALTERVLKVRLEASAVA